MTPSESSKADTFSPAITVNFSIRNTPSNKISPIKLISTEQPLSSKSPVRMAGFSNMAKTSSPASLGMAVPEPLVESGSAVHPANMIDFQTINFIQNKPSTNLAREAGSAVSSIKPAQVEGFNRTVTGGSSRFPVIVAAVPQNFIKSDQDGKSSAEELKQLKANFTSEVRERIALVKMYPRRARSRGFEGQPVVAFTLSRNGGLTKYSIVESSGHQILDKSALESVKKAVPYPPIPDKLDIEFINLKLPISYILK